MPAASHQQAQQAPHGQADKSVRGDLSGDELDEESLFHDEIINTNNEASMLLRLINGQRALKKTLDAHMALQKAPAVAPVQKVLAYQETALQVKQ